MERQNLFKTCESIESENCETLFCSHKTKNSRSLQKTYLEHRPRPPNVLSKVIWFITRVNFRSFGPVRDPLLAELRQRQTVFLAVDCSLENPNRVKTCACDKRLKLCLALENTSQVTIISPPQYDYCVGQRSVANVNSLTSTNSSVLFRSAFSGLVLRVVGCSVSV